MRKIKWSFDDDVVYDGFTDGTFWNGFTNVWVTPDVHATIRDMFKGDPHCDPDTQADFEAMEAKIHPLHPDLGPLVSYSHGFATSEVADE